jgi:D-arginine dehydrogenase
VTNPDVLVVGAGLAGLALAWHLAPHARVLVLDQGDGPGSEASAQNAGMVRRLVDDPIERALALRTAAFFADPGPDWSERSPSRVVGAVLALAVDAHHLDDGAAHLRARGVPVHLVDRPAEVAPVLAGSPLRAAWWLPEERLGDPWSLLQGYRAGLERHGGEVRARVRVAGLRVEGGRAAGVDTDRGPIAAERVVLATGAWSAALAAAHGLWRPLAPLRRTLLQTAPHPLATRDHPWVWLDDAGLYVRPEGGGWLVSACDEAHDPPPPGPGSRGPVEGAVRALAADKLARLLPTLADAHLAGGWSGLRTFAPDRRPVLGADPELPGLWWVAGLGGSGVTGGHAAAEAVACWMTDRPTPWLSPRAV